MLHLQRTIGNQATLRMIHRKTTGYIQRDDDGSDGGDQSTPVSENEQDTPEQEQEQNDPEIVEQDAELATIPPEAAQVEAEASAAKGTPVSDDDTDDTPSQDDTPVQDDAQGGSQLPSNAVSLDDGADPYDNNNGGSQGVSAVSSSPASTPLKKKNKRGKQGGGNAVYKPQFLGSSGVASAVSEGLGATKKAADVGIDGITAAYLIQEANTVKSTLPSSVDSASDESASSSLSGLEKVAEFMNTPPMNILLPVATLLQRVYAAYMKYKHFKAFKDLAESGGGINKEALLKNDPKLSTKAKLGTYGYLKTKRGLWTRATKAVLTFGQIIARLVTVASGLTSSLATEGADLAFALAGGVLKLSESLKGLIKIIKGTRGKHRAKAANQIVDSALAGDQDMLKFLVDSEALSKTWFVKMKAANSSGSLKAIGSFLSGMGIDPSKVSQDDIITLTNQPKNAQQMQDYLTLCFNLKLLQKVSAEVATVIKST
jgi:hypothetical protein